MGYGYVPKKSDLLLVTCKVRILVTRTQHANVIFATKTVIMIVMCSIRSGGLSEASRASHCSRDRAVSGDYHSRFQGGHAVLEIMVGLISLAF
jgi:hypothetical protein